MVSSSRWRTAFLTSRKEFHHVSPPGGIRSLVLAQMHSSARFPKGATVTPIDLAPTPPTGRVLTSAGQGEETDPPAVSIFAFRQGPVHRAKGLHSLGGIGPISTRIAPRPAAAGRSRRGR